MTSIWSEKMKYDCEKMSKIDKREIRILKVKVTLWCKWLQFLFEPHTVAKQAVKLMIKIIREFQPVFK